MAWRLLESPKTHRATKKLVQHFSEMPSVPRDRPLSDRRLKVYGKLLDAGLFRPVSWASARCLEDGMTYRVNGKHTSTMLSRLDDLPEFYVVVEEYVCDTLEDVAQLYSTFDSGEQSRSARDIYKSFAGTVPALAKVPDNYIYSAIIGIAYADMGNEMYAKSSPAERAEMLLDNVDFVAWSFGIIAATPTIAETGISVSSHKKNQHLLRRAVSAAMYKTYKSSVRHATEFWQMVRDENGPSPKSPDRKLARYLLTAGSGTVRRMAQTSAGTREIFVKCIHAWNAWRKGEPTDLKYYANAKIPDVA